jgi:hypothetical protein
LTLVPAVRRRRRSFPPWLQGSFLRRHRLPCCPRIWSPSRTLLPRKLLPIVYPTAGVFGFKMDSRSQRTPSSRRALQVKVCDS